MKLKLTPYDVQQPAWQQIKAHYEARLATLRAQLENPQWPADLRYPLVCRIDEIKGILAMGEPEQKNVAGAGE